MKVRDLLICVVVLTAVALFFYHQGRHAVVMSEIEMVYDTITVRDTIRDTVPIPQIKYRYVDTVKVKIVKDDINTEMEKPFSGDSIEIAVPLTMEMKEYKTCNYYALITGHNAQLLKLDVFPQTKYITRTDFLKIKPRWGLGIQVGYGMTPKRMVPYIGIGLQYNLLTW